MPANHFPFGVINNTLNRAVRPLLRSPLHGVLSDRLALLTVTGRRTGRVFTFPVNYQEHDGVLTFVPQSPERKRWWRNLTGAGAPVRVRLRGVERTGHGVAHGDERTGVRVEVRLDPAG
jgi:hypothetical protein